MDNKQILRGFDIFKTRQNSINSNDEFVSPHSFALLYKTFYETFEIGRNKLNVRGLYLTQINQEVGILEQKIDASEDLLLYDFLSIQEGYELIANAYEADDPIHGKYLWPIGDCASNKTLLVGLGQGEYPDKIFLENTSLFSDGSRFKQIAANIFDFVIKISYVELENLGYGIAGGYSDIYRKWGEDYWRITTG